MSRIGNRIIVVPEGVTVTSEDNHIHDANECCSIDSLMKQVEIYTIAIMKLLEN